MQEGGGEEVDQQEEQQEGKPAIAREPPRTVLQEQARTDTR